VTTQRQQLPDQIRGLALLGIIVVNVAFIGSSSDGFTRAATADWWDKAAAFAVVAFAQGKFFLIFSFVFGYSLSLMLRKLNAVGLKRYRRRLVGLAALGLSHALLLFWGDILLSYAILGVVLLLLINRSDKAVIRGAVGAFAFGAFLLALIVADELSIASSAPVVDSLSSLDAGILGSFGDGVAARRDALPELLITFVFTAWPYIIGMFLLGLLGGRHNILDATESRPRLWKVLGRLGLFVGLPLGVVAGLLEFGPGTITEVRQLWGFGIGYISAPLLSCGYLALAHRWRNSSALAWVAPGGHMSLTSYLGASVALNVVFAGWGFGKMNAYGALATVAIAAAVWFGLQLFARIWLARFRIGPMEWILRSWTYGAVQPLIRGK